MSQVVTCTFLGALLMICSGFSASAEERFALLIGNKNYGPQVGALKNPHKDIALIEKSLQQVGFQVVSKKDLGRVEMHRQISAFIERLSKAGPRAVGFFYYVGHGVSNPHNRNNYLIPIDILNIQDPDLWINALPLDLILRDLERDAPNASHIVVFDACRNELRLSVRAGVKGFAPVTAMRGTFIAFSTSPNATSSDGEDNGPYAQALASELIKPGQEHLTLFQNVKERVISATDNTQWPWESNGLLRFYFAGRQTSQDPIRPATPEPASHPPTKPELSQDSLSKSLKLQIDDKVLGKMPGTGYPIRMHTLALDLPLDLVSTISSVEYWLHHPDFKNPKRPRVGDRNFRVSWRGWGCIDDAEVRAKLVNGREFRSRFSLCDLYDQLPPGVR